MSSRLSSERVIGRGQVVTTNATLTTVKRIPVLLGQTIRVLALVVGKRIGGSSGSAGDSASFTLEATYKNVSGTVSIVGSLEKLTNEDQAPWNATLNISGTQVLVQVAGASSNSIKWVCTNDVQNV